MWQHSLKTKQRQFDNPVQSKPKTHVPKNTFKGFISFSVRQTVVFKKLPHKNSVCILCVFSLSTCDDKIYLKNVKFTLEEAMKAQTGIIYSSTLSFTLVLDGVSGQRHIPAALPLGKTRYSFTGGCVGPRAGLDRSGKSRPYRDSILIPSTP